MPIKSRIRTVPDFPKKGIMFRDVTSLIADPIGLRVCVDDFARYYKETDIDLIVGIDSRGFIFGAALAYVLQKGFVPVRKKGKLPLGACVTIVGPSKDCRRQEGRRGLNVRTWRHNGEGFYGLQMLALY